ncbi:MAG: succinylglutamate desuccinylase/aspartoacylase family protein [Thermoplasmata archaeon]
MEKDIFIDELYHNYFKLYNFGGNGKKVLIISGLHGDEYTSILANNILISKVPKNIKFNLTIIPIANMGAFLYRSRTSPYGAEDLNRIFPGNKNGTLCERLAEKIFSIAMENDIIIDIHSCGFLCIPHIIAMYRQKNDVFELVKKIGIKYVVESKGTSGQLMTEAIKRGKKAIIIEVPSGFGGYIQEKYAKGLFTALLNFLLEKENNSEQKFLGKIEKIINEKFGYFRPLKKVLNKREVTKGDEIGRLDNNIIRSNDNGVIISIHYPSYLFKGEVMYEIAKNV